MIEVKESAESEQKSVKNVQLKTLKNNFRKMERNVRKPWITQEKLEEMEERRKYNSNNIEHVRLNNELRRETIMEKRRTSTRHVMIS